MKGRRTLEQWPIQGVLAVANFYFAMKDKIKITSLLRIRNEELLLPDTLWHLSEFSDEIFVFDDCSFDNTVKICREYPKVKKILRNYFHNSVNQSFVQTAQRKLLLDYARATSKNKWMFMFDCDERIEFDFSKLEQYDRDGISGVYFQLLDGYMTPKYKSPYCKGKLEDLKRMWGPEMREIIFLFRKDKADYDLKIPGCRQPNVEGKTVVDGFVRHYGKCLSIRHHQETCRYYMASMPQLAEKWKKRLGKAIHTESDFSNKLYTWKEAKKNAIKI